MQQTNITPEFNDIEEKNLMKIIVLCSMFFTILPPLIAYFAFPEKLTKASKEIVVAMANFEIAVLATYIIFGFIPLLGILLVLLPLFVNIIVCIKVIIAIANNKIVNIPVFIPFLQTEENDKPNM